jgi:hypothetical protein
MFLFIKLITRGTFVCVSSPTLLCGNSIIYTLGSTHICLLVHIQTPTCIHACFIGFQGVEFGSMCMCNMYFLFTILVSMCAYLNYS